MAKEYSKEQFWKLYEKLPEELKEAIFSAETADNIWDICEGNGVNEVSKIAERVGHVLLGVLPLENFQNVIEKDLNLEKETAKKVVYEINRFIFYPVKPALEQLYKIEITPSEKPKEEAKPEEKKPVAPPKEDIYREAVE